MPEPSVEPMPLPPTELRLAVPLDEHEASYLAASASTASLRWTVCNEEDGLESNTVLIYSVLDFRATARFQLPVVHGQTNATRACAVAPLACGQWHCARKYGQVAAAVCGPEKCGRAGRWPAQTPHANPRRQPTAFWHGAASR